MNLFARGILRVILLVFLLGACPGGNRDFGDVAIQHGDLVNKRGKHFQYMRGNLVDCRNISVDYLEGDVRGNGSKGVWVNVMHGNVEAGLVTVNVLFGNIIDGKNGPVNVIFGKDFSGKAKIGRAASRR